MATKPITPYKAKSTRYSKKLSHETASIKKKNVSKTIPSNETIPSATAHTK